MSTNGQAQTSPLPLFGISMGDPASIGPEVTARAVISQEVLDICRPWVVGDVNVMRRVVQGMGLEAEVVSVEDPEPAQFNAATINVLDLANVDMSRWKPGEVNAMCGQAAFEYVRRVIELAMEGTVAATVTGPIHKESINLAGHAFGGHTEIYARYTNTDKVAMLLVEENLRVVHVSTHVSLREACDLVRKDRILDSIILLDQACKRIGIERPRLGVAGLNPHASDGGLFGHEEEREILPAVEAAQARGIQVQGPIPADTLFPKAIGGMYDGCVAMYHDQGHIPFKVVGFQWNESAGRMKSVRGVNITLGLPIIRTSVDHGTAMEIAGQYVASADAMQLAIAYAARLYRPQSGATAACA